MQVLLPNGTLMSVEKVVAVCEQRVPFNGRKNRLCECASELAYANAMAFSPAEASRGIDCFSLSTSGTVLIGNLSNEFVRETLSALTAQGYCDLSGLKLQKSKPSVNSYVCDNGESAAYILQGYEASVCCGNALGLPLMSWAPPVDEAEDEAEEDDDE